MLGLCSGPVCWACMLGLYAGPVCWACMLDLCDPLFLLSSLLMMTNLDLYFSCVGRHKIIILDEADSMTAAAQQALRRTMEIYSQTTRFALACNNSTKIIEPIQSRCAVLRFTRLSDAEVLSRLQYVIEEEHIQYENSGLEAIIFTAEGDMRNALNALQSTVSGFGYVNSENVFKVCDQPQPTKIRVAIEK